MNSTANVNLQDRSRYHALSMASLAVAAVVAPLLMVFSTQSASATAPLAAVLAAMAAVGASGQAAVRAWVASAARAPLALAVTALLVWAAISLLWTPAPSNSIVTFLALAGMIATTVLLTTLVPRLRVEAAGLWLVTGTTAMAALLAVEVWFDSPLRAALGANPDPSRLNRPMAFLVLLIFPVLAALLAGRRYVAALAFAALVACAVLPSTAQAASLGLGLGGLACAAALARPRIALALVAVTAVAGFIAAPFVLPNLLDNLPPGLETALKGASARERMAIWQGYGREFWQAPLLGAGFGAAEGMTIVGTIALPWDPRLVERAFVPGHSHSAFLQVWVELGLVGALAAGLALAGVLAAMGGLPRRACASATGCFVAAYAIAYVGHGAWQAWWYGALAFAMCWIAVLSREEMGEVA